jgi:hypothetical protein
MFENLSDKLDRAFKVLKGSGIHYRNKRGRNHEGDP